MKQNKEKGITLIALVITIIVLLILAGVAITTLAGDNGILTKAVQAKDATRGGEVKDYVRMAIAENAMADNTNGERKTKAQIISELRAQGKLTAEEVAKLTDGENPVDVITIGGIEIDFGELLTLVEMYAKAVADGCTNENGTCQNKGHLHIGDYVDYENPTSGAKKANATDTGYGSDQIYEASENQLNWRVLGKDTETGGIKLISGRPMKSNNSENDPYLHLYGAKGYINAESVLNNICAMYTTSYGTARSVNIKDINEITGVTTEEKIKEFNKAPKWYGSKQYGEAYSFENHYTPQSWLEGKKQVAVSGTVNAYAYTINSGNNPIVELVNTRAYKMLFENVDKAYFWLASCSCNAYSDRANFCVGEVFEGGVEGGVGVYSYSLFASGDGREYDNYYGVRPTISLKSGITEKEVPKIADKAEDTWN